MANDYARIAARSADDPGTAGDQTEETWATILRDWLPSNYHVVTKGRLLGPNGETSPQIDLLVLTPSYPRHLLNQKHYFAGGVVAAFECKLNVRARDWSKVFSNAAKIKKVLRPVLGTPFDELHQPPFFGLLAHSATQKAAASADKERPLGPIHTIRRFELEFVEHPREMLDLVCIADEGTFVLNKSAHVHPHTSKSALEMLKESGVREGIVTMYLAHAESSRLKAIGFDTTGETFGTLIHALTRYIAFHDPSVRGFADYLLSSGTWGGVGVPVAWRLAVLSPAVIKRLRGQGYEANPWSKWSEHWNL